MTQDNYTQNADAHSASQRPRVLLDCDGVLSDFVSAYLKIVEQITGRSYQPEQVTQFDVGLSLGLSREESSACKRALGGLVGFCDSLAVYPDAQEGVAELQRIADVYIVTSPWNSCPTWTFERESWLARHFDIRANRVIHTAAKHVCAGDYLIDDKVSAVIAWHHENPRGLGIIWDTPHNRLGTYDEGVRTRNWGALCRLISGRTRVQAGLAELVENAPAPIDHLFDLGGEG